MKIAAPLPYVDRIEKKKSVAFVVRMEEFVEWDVPEISIGDTTEAIKASATRETFEGALERYPIEIRAYKGHLFRRTGYNGGPDSIALGHIPRLEEGAIKCDSDSFARLQCYHPIINNTACSMLGGHRGYRSITNVADWELELLGRKRQKALVEKMLDKLVLVDGELWKRVADPRVEVSVIFGRGVSSRIDFNEDDERAKPRFPYPTIKEVKLPVCEAYRVDAIADRFGLPLTDIQFTLTSISPDAPICGDGRLWTAWNAADFVTKEVGSVLGTQSATAVANWLALREALSIRDANMSAEDVLAMVDGLKTSLGPDCRRIVTGTDELLEFIVRPEHSQALRGPTP